MSTVRGPSEVGHDLGQGLRTVSTAFMHAKFVRVFAPSIPLCTHASRAIGHGHAAVVRTAEDEVASLWIHVLLPPVAICTG